MATISFNTATPTGCGCTNPTNATNCLNAINVWRAYIVAHPGDTLTMRADLGTYLMNFGWLLISEPLAGSQGLPDYLSIPSCTIMGDVGTTVSNYFQMGIFNDFPTYMNGYPDGYGTIRSLGCGTFIETCYAGATTIKLINVAEATNPKIITVGHWIAVCGIITQYGGYPPNFERVEYHQIMGVNTSTGVVTLDGPLEKSYDQTWANVPGSSSGDQPTQGGAACIYKMPSNWDIVQNVHNIHALDSSTDVNLGGGVNKGFAQAPIREMNFVNCTFDVVAPCPTVVKKVTFTGCTWLNETPEIDKMMEEIVLDDCHIRAIKIQSASPNRLFITNCTIDQGLTPGTGLNCTIEDTTFTSGAVIQLGTDWGMAESLVITNCSGYSTQLGLHGANVDYVGNNGTGARYTYLGAGLWRMRPTAVAINVTQGEIEVQNFVQTWVPSFQYAFARGGGGGMDIHPIETGGVPVYFCCLHVYNTPRSGEWDDYFVQTSMTYAAGSLPTLTFGGSALPFNTFQGSRYRTMTVDGVHQGGDIEETADCPITVDGAVTPEPEPTTAALMPAGCM